MCVLFTPNFVLLLCIMSLLQYTGSKQLKRENHVFKQNSQITVLLGNTINICDHEQLSTNATDTADDNCINPQCHESSRGSSINNVCAVDFLDSEW